MTPALIRPLQPADLPEADRVFRLAFATFIGLPDPAKFAPGRDMIGSRIATVHAAALAAEVNGQFAGSNVLTRWGGFGFFGPLTVRPELWEHGVGKQLLAASMDLFAQWGTRRLGLFTFAHSAKHAGLYQKFGFWPRFLTAIMSKPAVAAGKATQIPEAQNFSALPVADRAETLTDCHALAVSLCEELDLTDEIRAVQQYRLGETVILRDGQGVSGFAICHFGAGTEGGPETCYVKFAAARSSSSFEQLLQGCDSICSTHGLARVEAGVNLARHEAYRIMLAQGFRTDVQGVAMHRDNDGAHCRPGVFALDDWR